MLIEILGIIGAGKSTLLETFPTDYEIVREPVDENAWLPIFYAELAYVEQLKKVGRYAPAVSTPLMECYLAAKRKNDIDKAKKVGKPVVTDFGRPQVFARMLLAHKTINEFDYTTFLEISKACEIVPEIVIYLDSLDRAYVNMKNRGRAIESGLTYEYLTNLHREYEKEIAALESSRTTSIFKIKWGNGGNLNPIIEYLRGKGLPHQLNEEKFNQITRSSKLCYRD